MSTPQLLKYRAKLEEPLRNTLECVNNPERTEMLPDHLKETFILGNKQHAIRTQWEINAVERELASRGGR
jgi:hypothetical protein